MDSSYVSVPELRFRQHIRSCKICKAAGGEAAEDRDQLCPEGQERDRLLQEFTEKVVKESA